MRPGRTRTSAGHCSDASHMAAPKASANGTGGILSSRALTIYGPRRLSTGARHYVTEFSATMDWALLTYTLRFGNVQRTKVTVTAQRPAEFGHTVRADCSGSQQPATRNTRRSLASELIDRIAVGTLATLPRMVYDIANCMGFRSIERHCPTRCGNDCGGKNEGPSSSTQCGFQPVTCFEAPEFPI